VVAFTTTRWNTLQLGGAPESSSAPGLPTTGDCVAFALGHLAVQHALNSCRDADELAEVAERNQVRKTPSWPRSWANFSL
jgi:hypothetical protein